MRRVVCVGDIMMDVVAHLPRELAVGSDTPSQIAVHGGGSAANTAAWLAVAEVPTTFVGRVGDDALGRSALDELSALGVNLQVTVDPTLPTGICIVLVDPTGERTMIPSAGANAIGGSPPGSADGAHLHVSGYALFHPMARAAAIDALRAAHDAGSSVSVDTASTAPLRDFGAAAFLEAIGVGLLFANAAEAAVLSGRADPAAAAVRLGERCGEAIVKCGVDGAVWSDGARVVRETPAAVVPLDSTGAGEAFAAGVLAARLSGADVTGALRAGNDLAALAVSQRGARP